MEYRTIHTPIKPHYRATQIVWYIFYIIQTLLLFRLLLKLIGANTAAGFTQMIYNGTLPLVQPFQSIVAPWRFSPGIFDWNILIAMFVYWIVAWVIVELILMTAPVSAYEAQQKLNAQRKD